MNRIKSISFNTKMVQAILDGRKTVTRRRIKPKQLIGLGCDLCPNNMPEEYIKEKKQLFKPYCDMSDDELISAIYKPPCKKGNIIHMSKSAPCIWLRVRDVRAERLQDMDKMDTVKEGIDPRCYVNLAHALARFVKLWNSTIKKQDQDLYVWDANPWVWVIEFKRCEKPKEGKKDGK